MKMKLCIIVLTGLEDIPKIPREINFIDFEELAGQEKTSLFLRFFKKH